jgi:hypothetical protein
VTDCPTGFYWVYRTEHSEPEIAQYFGDNVWFCCGEEYSCIPYKVSMPRLSPPKEKSHRPSCPNCGTTCRYYTPNLACVKFNCPSCKANPVGETQWAEGCGPNR